jgi:hypothetical protein
VCDGVKGMPYVIKPIHVPILLAMGIALLSQSDAGISTGRRHRHTTAPPSLQSVAEMGHHSASPALSRIDSFSRRVYMDLAKLDWNATAVAGEFSDEFAQLTAGTEGGFGATLSALVELRMLDLQMSIRRARLMRDVVGILVGGCAVCAPV